MLLKGMTLKAFFFAFVCLMSISLKAQNDYSGIRSTLITYQNTDTGQYLIRFKVVIDCGTAGFYFDSLGVTAPGISFGIPFSDFTKVSERNVGLFSPNCTIKGRCEG